MRFNSSRSVGWFACVLALAAAACAVMVTVSGRSALVWLLAAAVVGHWALLAAGVWVAVRRAPSTLLTHGR